ncbi:uncharacterized protein KY384_000802 [Bacidia gigantensis]|uniref:uncharacterized protein n=1 Tax=Bacidia gigantensis TaxID=2732470 RepID=UPI001D05A568|nr:uncharacterized protein KY384_000802 [Bacidia gigantensis]KAG8526040.1 hypothetical protein KY384_000802 [Bacidia gigantensis]
MPKSFINEMAEKSRSTSPDTPPPKWGITEGAVIQEILDQVRRSQAEDLEKIAKLQCDADKLVEKADNVTESIGNVERAGFLKGLMPRARKERDDIMRKAIRLRCEIKLLQQHVESLKQITAVDGGELYTKTWNINDPTFCEQGKNFEVFRNDKMSAFFFVNKTNEELHDMAE